MNAVQRTLEKVSLILASQAGVNPNKVGASTTFDKDLGLDDLAVLEVVMAAEFSISIPDKEIGGMKTAQDLTDMVLRLTS